VASASEVSPSVAFLGLGAMGGRMARRLLAVRRVVVWNRTRAKADELAADGAVVAPSPAAAVEGVDVVITMLADPEALVAVSEGADGFVASLSPGQTVVEMSTVGPEAVARLRRALPDRVALVDAPVLGSRDEAENGALVVLAGGSSGDVERLRPLLERFGTVIHAGDTGAGAAAKLVANSTLFGVLTVLGEAVALADGLGLDRDATFEVLARTPLAAQAERRRDALEHGSFPPRFALSLARKDAALVGEAARTAGVGLPVAAAALAWLTAAVEAGAGESDYTAVLETIVRRG
jgi:3-hydroxyisobutyrate dehydrogenase/2-hydroxy-3-oxopropionate reductase